MSYTFTFAPERSYAFSETPLCQRKWGLLLSYSHGIITVNNATYPSLRERNPAPCLAQSAILERHAQRFRELKRDLESLYFAFRLLAKNWALAICPQIPEPLQQLWWVAPFDRIYSNRAQDLRPPNCRFREDRCQQSTILNA
jgi:hypothetical protein